MSTQIDSTRSSKFSELEHHLNLLEKDFQETIDTSSKKSLTLKDSILKIEKRIDEELQYRDQFFQTKTGEISHFQERIQDVLTKFLKSKKEAENKIFKQIEDKFEGLKLRLLEESKNFKESANQAQECIEDDIPKLLEFVKRTIGDRQLEEQGLSKRLENSLSNMESDLVVETKTREETEEAMLAMLRDVVSRIKNDLEVEKKERESSEETLLRLLEETCAKISTVTSY